MLIGRCSNFIKKILNRFLDNGELVGDGTHEELLEQCEVYQEIYLSQGGNLHKEGGKEHA
ncbi:hypothetical protein BM74_04845 [Bacillus thuringiensis]|uniref:ABC transporter ATP-binding protein n=1 Tax=Bacillus thuringiensis TaxID=1428 RepID=A0A437SQ02_BACTU|nr:hypothetical protein [Bacillus thuringiensis]RVU65287.1 hypothetical protein BM74_04845 [Bacillus thuringiensis]